MRGGPPIGKKAPQRGAFLLPWLTSAARHCNAHLSMWAASKSVWVTGRQLVPLPYLAIIRIFANFARPVLDRRHY
jgi:hypothetical protein